MPTLVFIRLLGWGVGHMGWGHKPFLNYGFGPCCQPPAPTPMFDYPNNFFAIQKITFRSIITRISTN